MRAPPRDARTGVSAIVAVAVVAAVLGTAACAGSRAAPVTTTAADSAHAGTIDSARAVLRATARSTAGLAVAVYREGEPVWVEGIGWADLSVEIPVDPARTRFRIYSVAKPMTATAALRLAEAGSLDPSASIRRYLPGLSDTFAETTALQLGTHTSGVRHYADEAEARDPGRCETVDDALPIFVNDPLVQAPGSGESYSSWGFVLLSAVVASAAGQPFPAAMQRLVFEPAGMEGVAVDDPAADVPERATPYVRTPSETDFRPAPGVDNSCKWGAGGFVATAEDVARFGAALLDGSLISDRSLAMFLRGAGTFTAGGIGVGGTALLYLDSSSGTVIVLASNTSGETAADALREGMSGLVELF